MSLRQNDLIPSRLKGVRDIYDAEPGSECGKSDLTPQKDWATVGNATGG